ncbi:WD40 repeat-like protein [Serendipita vermifera]|nr:WD40 repeat-like protein [Serendipita vermifera]
MSATPSNNPFRQLDSALAVANLAKDTLAAAPVPSPIKDAAAVLITVLETIREVKSNKEAWAQFGTTLSNQIDDIQANVGGCSPPHSTMLLQMANRYEIKLNNILTKVRAASSRNLLDRHLNRRTDKEEIAQLKSDMDACWKDFMLELSIKTHEAMNRTEAVVNRTDEGVNHLLYNSYIKSLEVIKDSGWDVHRACLPGTRTNVLDAINAWVNDPTSDQVLWLTDVAGSGKSTIARHLAEQWRRSGKLGGFFFFNKNVVEATSIRLFCTTIAAQLAHHPQYKSQLQSSIIDGMKELIPTPPFKEKLMKLVIEPSKGLDLVLVIDALDECNENERIILLDCLLCLIKQSPHLKSFITSRPELDIERRLHKYQSHTDSLHQANFKSNQADIEIFVSDQMKDLVSDGTFDANDVGLLCKRVNCLFILASTACRAIHNHPDPAVMLEILLDPRGDNLVDINRLYLKILENACQLKEMDERSWKAMQAKMMQVLKAIISAAIPLSVSCFDLILGIKGTERVIKSLASVLSVAANKTVLLLHPTFREFLLDSKVANHFYIDIAEAHALMAKGCLQVMRSELKFNICGLESSFLLNSQVDDLEVRISTSISRQLQYSSVHWPVHVINSDQPSHDQQITKAILQICKSPYAFYWMEILSALSQVPSALSGLQAVKNWLLEKSAKKIVYDLWQFLLSFSTPISDSLPHIYLSALPFSPIELALHQEGYKTFPNLLLVVRGCSNTWPDPPQVWQGHTKTIHCVSFSPDGHQVVSGSDDRTIRLWDTETHQAIGEPLRGHTGSVRSLAFSPDGSQIVSGSGDKSIRLWDTKTGQPIGKPLQGHTKPLESVAFSPDGHQVISWDGDSIQLWDVKTGQPIREPFQVHNWVISVMFSLNGHQIVSASRGETIHLWDAETGNIIEGPLQGHIKLLNQVAFSPDGCHIASAFSDATIQLWNTKTSQLIWEPFQGHTGSIRTVAFSPDGHQIASCSNDYTIRLWNTETGLAIGEPLQGHTGSVRSVAFSPDGHQIISCSSDKTLRLWDTETGQTIGEPFQASGLVAISPDGCKVVSSSGDKLFQLWDTKTGQVIGKPLQGNTNAVLAVAFSPEGHQIISCSEDNTIRSWDTETGQAIGEPIQGHTSRVIFATFSPDVHKIVSILHDNTLKIWNTETGQTIGKVLQGHTRSINRVAFSPDSHRIASCSEDHTIRIWDTETSQAIGKSLHAHTSAVISVAFSPDGHQIVSGSADNTILLWDAETGQTMGEPLRGHTNWIVSVAFSPNGQQIVSGSWDNTIQLWDTQTGQAIGEPLQGHIGSVNFVAFSPDGHQIISWSEDRTIRFWNVQNSPESQKLSGAFNPLVPPMESSQIAHDPGSLPYNAPDLIQYQLHHKPYGPHFSVPGFDNCTLAQDGWVKSSDQLLYWVPPSNRNGLQHPHILTIPTSSPLRATWIDFSHFQCGFDWTKVQDPL